MTPIMLSILISVFIGLPLFVGNIIFWGRYYKINNVEHLCEYDDKVQFFGMGLMIGVSTSVLILVPIVNLFVLPILGVICGLIFSVRYLFILGTKLDKISFQVKKEN